MSNLDGLTIGVIGGAGRMGSFFLNQLRERGYTHLLFSDTNEEKAFQLQGKFDRRTNQDLATTCDVSIISVPPQETVRVAREIAPYIKLRAVASNFCSIQTPGLEALASCEGYDVVGVHPMFRESVKSMDGRNIAIVPYRNDNNGVETLQEILKPTGANLRVLTPEKHDKAMICMQALLHFNTFVLTSVLREYSKRYGIGMSELDLLETPNLALNRIVMGRIFSTGNPELYAGIQMENPDVPEMLDIYSECVGKLSNFIKGGDAEYFKNYFEKLARFFGSIHTAWSAKASDDIVDFLKRMGSYASVVQQREKELRDYYSNEYRQSLERAGCVGKEYIPTKLKKIGKKFLGIGGYLERGEYDRAIEATNSLKHLAELNKPQLKEGYSIVVASSEEFIRRCNLLVESIKEMPYAHQRNGNH